MIIGREFPWATGAQMAEGWIAALGKFFYLTVLAIAGILMRHAHAAASEGQFQTKSFFLACLTAPALGVIAGGLAEHFGASGLLKDAIVAITGFLGPAFVHAAALAIQGKILGKIKR
jgi:hypothetical protein